MESIIGLVLLIAIIVDIIMIRLCLRGSSPRAYWYRVPVLADLTERMGVVEALIVTKVGLLALFILISVVMGHWLPMAFPLAMHGYSAWLCWRER